MRNARLCSLLAAKSEQDGRWGCAAFLFARLLRAAERKAEFALRSGAVPPGVTDAVRDARWNIVPLYLHPSRRVDVVKAGPRFLLRRAAACLKGGGKLGTIGQDLDLAWLRAHSLSYDPDQRDDDDDGGPMRLAPAYDSEPREAPACADDDWLFATRLASLYAIRGDGDAAVAALAPFCAEACGGPARNTCDLVDVVQLHAALLAAFAAVDGGPTACELAPWGRPPAAEEEAYTATPRTPPTANRSRVRCSDDGAECFDDGAGAPLYPPRRVGAKVGVFVLQSVSSRSYVEQDGALALAFRAVHAADSALARTARLHVLVHERGEAKIADEWVKHLGAAAAADVWGGCHSERVGALPRSPADGNYLRKALAMVAMSRRRGYETLVSLDDDVLFAPAALAALLRTAPAAVFDPAPGAGGNGCAMLTPIISSGIPTAEAFADDFLSGPDRIALDDCFAGAWCAELEAHDAAAVAAGEAPPRPSGGEERRELAASPLAHARWLETSGDGVRPVGAGVHPVRWNATCAALSLAAASKHIEAHFDAVGAGVDRVEAFGAGGAPYMCNSAWATTPGRLLEVLVQVERFDFTHPFDEAAMSKFWLHERSAKLCVLREAFVLHPSYGAIDKLTALHCARPAPPDDARWASLGRHTDGAGVDTRKPLPRAHSAQAPSDNCAACAAPWQSHDGFFSRGEHSRACRLCQTPYCAYCKREKMVRKRQSLTAADSAAWRCKAACPTPAAAPSVAV
ncbi:hypothetical protein M885DRAFT_612882 [Pelagophyceae sp. CCMP2097]|nr:hypothetical protein M885DRAFT_612882 [Pelagophyceae sp. CCMP2097]